MQKRFTNNIKFTKNRSEYIYANKYKHNDLETKRVLLSSQTKTMQIHQKDYSLLIVLLKHGDRRKSDKQNTIYNTTKNTLQNKIKHTLHNITQ